MWPFKPRVVRYLNKKGYCVEFISNTRAGYFNWRYRYIITENGRQVKEIYSDYKGVAKMNLKRWAYGDTGVKTRKWCP